MIHSYKGKVLFECSENDKMAEAEIYSDLACIFDAIQKEFGLNILLKYLEIYTKGEIEKYGSRN